MPSWKTSVRPSTGLSNSCSGARYDILPFTPPRVWFSCKVALATPKSTILTTPLKQTIRLDGVTSRCTIGCGWPAASVAVCAQ